MPSQKFSLAAKQEVFYSICLAFILLLRTYLPKFTSYKASYTSGFADDLETEVKAAKDLPNPKTATARRKQLRIDAAKAAKAVRYGWLGLKGHIKKAYPKASQAAQLQQAGWEYFKKGASDWSAIKSLIGMANDYMADNAVKLKENDNMPDGFPAQFIDLGKEFNTVSQAFEAAEQNKSNAVVAKNNANKAVYEKIITVATDGQYLFKNDSVKRRWFSYAYQRAILTGGACSLRGTVLDQNGNPIPGATITSTDGKYTATTNAKGYFRITKMLASSYIFNISKSPYASLEQPVTLQPGIAHTIHVKLSPALEAVA